MKVAYMLPLDLAQGVCKNEISKYVSLQVLTHMKYGCPVGKTTWRQRKRFWKCIYGGGLSISDYLKMAISVSSVYIAYSVKVNRFCFKSLCYGLSSPHNQSLVYVSLSNLGQAEKK